MLPSPFDPDLVEQLEAMAPSDIDALPFGVIGFDREEIVTIYNTYEAEAAGLACSTSNEPVRDGCSVHSSVGST